MKTVRDSVATKDGQSWSYEKVLPESVAEAVETYGEDGTLYLIHAALTVKEQAIARELFKQGKSEDEVNKAVRSYKPGEKRAPGGKVTKKMVMDRIISLAENLAQEPEAKQAVREAIAEGDWKKANEILDVLEHGE